MAFKPITKLGEEFIRNRCVSSGTFGSDRFSGKRKFSLPKSNVPKDTVFTASPVNEKNLPITTADELATNLIRWFNAYCKTYLLDANIIAAQAYAESGYNLWIYSEGGAMGISQFLDSAIFDTIIKNKDTFASEIEDIVNNLSGDPNDVRIIIPNFNTRDKSIVSTKDTTEIAKENRKHFFQNIINNPMIMIKAQCVFMNRVGQRNNNLASSSLFAYNRGGYLSSTSYDDMISKTEKRYGKEYIKEGLTYVDRIFKLLAGKEAFLPMSKIDPKKAIGFGYDIDFSEANLKYFNISNSVLISGDFPLSVAQEKFIQTLHPVAQDTFRQFIFLIQKETPFTVDIRSTYRDFAEQARQKAINEAKVPARPAANPGNSFHNYGLAIDIALDSKTVKDLRYSFNMSVEKWKETGVIAIADKLNLRWGGTFAGDQLDVVHFDLGFKYSISTCKTLAQQTYGNDPTKVQGNQIPLVA
jgi:hypothetical protein